ncbi:hypothetical protein NEOLEDRAFT_446128 [Neolentinus lepideus HHB14362 ss-1]|uniref:Uncharacterized protein n=1 Tax=Neolentinus lepideus HHB14362 ss-1 TaxID=1314782 RepID=A0A165RS88_9AGAM|nr:hypothetical protein NEOLEDRAFT_446128 [Neolentinus lepideus HHB14362 ss-1]
MRSPASFMSLVIGLWSPDTAVSCCIVTSFASLSCRGICTNIFSISMYSNLSNPYFIPH